MARKYAEEYFDPTTQLIMDGLTISPYTMAHLANTKAQEIRNRFIWYMNHIEIYIINLA